MGHWGKLLRLSAEQVTGYRVCSHCVADICNPCFSSSLLNVSYISALPVSGWSEPKQVLLVLPQKSGEAGLSPCSPFPGEGNSL